MKTGMVPPVSGRTVCGPCGEGDGNLTVLGPFRRGAERRILSVMSAALLAVSAFAADRVFDFRPQSSSGANVSASLSQRANNVSILRTHCVRADRQESDGEVAVGDILTFQLFNDKEFRVRIVERLPSLTEAKSWMGVAEGYGETVNSVVVWTGHGWQLDVQDFLNGRAYRVFSAENGMVSVCESNPNAVKKKCGNDKLPRVDANKRINYGKTGVKMADSTSLTYVDILVVFDSAAQSWCNKNGTTINAFATTAVAKMNTALANTGLNSSFRYRLAGAWGINGSGGTDLEAVLDACDEGGWYNGVNWGQVEQKRNEVGADVVTVLLDIGDQSGMVTTGIGFCPHSDPGGGVGWIDNTYNCCAIDYVANDHTMTHEVGHNMGCGHADSSFVNTSQISPGPGAFSYSSGYHFHASGTAYHTIMAYDFDGWGNSYESCPYFSSPNYTFYGVSVGNSTHDNSRTLRASFARVAALRAEKSNVWPYDSFANARSATPLTAASGSSSGSNSSATTESGEPLESRGHTVWWAWKAPAGGKAWFSTEGSSFDTYMGIYTGSSVSSLTKIDENDDYNSPDRYSRIDFAANKGTTYYICVSGYGSSNSGTIKLTWNQDVPPGICTVWFCAGAHGKRTGGGDMKQAISYGGYATAPTIQAYPGWRFQGWDKSTGPIYDNTAITAQYVGGNCGVTFDAGSKGRHVGGGNMKQTIPFGGKVTNPPGIKANTGYKFLGWDGNLNLVTRSVTMTAQYDVGAYTATFVIDTSKGRHVGGGNMKQTVAYKNSPAPPGVRAKPGYVFKGWSPAISGMTKNQTFTAVFQAQ